jgi:hypothetical protein
MSDGEGGLASVAPRVQTSARSVPGADTLRGVIRLFFQFPTPRLFAAKALILLAARGFLGPLSGWDALVLLGIALYWPFQEWLLHATVLHLRPRDVLGVHVDPYFARRHRWHHRHPWVLEGTFLPLRVVVPLLPINVGLWWLVMPTVGLAATATLGMTLAALLYEWVHYLAHTPYRPRSAYFRRVVHNHGLHHFRSERHWYAFSVPWIDQLLGTGPEASRVAPSPTARTLGVEERG